MAPLENSKYPYHPQATGPCQGNAHGENRISDAANAPYHGIHNSAYKIKKADDSQAAHAILDDLRV